MQDHAQASDVERWRANLRGEIEGTALYTSLAEAEQDERRAEIFRQLAGAEKRHAAHWRQMLLDAGIEPDEPQALSFRTRLLIWLARRFGPSAVLSRITAQELQDQGMYRNQPDAGRLSADEQTHARVLSTLVRQGGAGSILATERWHSARDAGGSFRAGIFGLNDGLASNLSLVMGVAGADPGQQVIVLAGVAGLLAGAFSMGVGEYISMTQQREMFKRQIGLEKEELEAFPEEERDELSLIYQAKGIEKQQAESLAAQLMQDPAQALDTLAREELGLDPEALGSPWGAAISSFLLFAMGAIIPVVPFLLGGSGTSALIVSAGLSGIALFGFGAVLSFFTGRNPIYSGLRTLLITSAGAVITFTIGRLIGVATT